MQRASGALHLVHRVERRSMLKLRLVPGGKDGAAIGHGARCSVDRNGEVLSGAWLLGRPAQAFPSTPQRPGAAAALPQRIRRARRLQAGLRSPYTKHVSPDRRQRASSRKMPRSQPGHNGHGGFVWLSLGNDHVFSDRWNDGLRRRMRGGGGSHLRTVSRN